jgi:lincosamide nucleotidyltransferase A/C/D/E
MTQDEVVRLLDALAAAGVSVWVDGGWGVDALFEERRREHDDLDLVAALEDVPTLQAVVRGLGYDHQSGDAPVSFELVDPDGRQVDVHPVDLDEHGNGRYRMQNGGIWVYPADGLAGAGVIGGLTVRCLTPELQMRVHSGYELEAKDHDEIRALHARFGVALPDGYV